MKYTFNRDNAIDNIRNGHYAYALIFHLSFWTLVGACVGYCLRLSYNFYYGPVLFTFPLSLVIPCAITFIALFLVMRANVLEHAWERTVKVLGNWSKRHEPL